MQLTKIVTLGCRLNIQESREIQQKLQIKNNPNDIIVINTCCVTQEALRKTRQTIRKTIRQNKDKKVIVTGCAAQNHRKEIEKIEGIYRIIDNQQKLDISLYQTETEKQPKHNIIKQQNLLQKPQDQTRAFVKIQNGCDHSCTFCIIPHARGKNCSVAADDIIEQIRQFCHQGYQECILTGVDIAAYGKDRHDNITIGTLVEKILTEVPQLQRLRLSSIDCAEIPQRLIECLAEKRLMPHLHLSLQSGDDIILKRMKRRHSRQNVIDFCHEARKIRPDLVFGADLIAGFPTESPTHFNNTLQLIEECNLTFLHIFPFSAHSQTPAARMPQIDKNIILKRAKILRQKAEIKKIQMLENNCHSTQQILIEQNGFARTPHYLPVRYSGKAKQGQITEAFINGHDGKTLLASDEVKKLH